MEIPNSAKRQGGRQLVRSHVSEEDPEVPIRVEVHVRDLTAEEDAALLEALGLEGSPPAGRWNPLGRTDGRRAAHQGRLGQRSRLRAIS